MGTNIGGGLYRYNEALSKVDLEFENNGGEVTPEMETMLAQTYAQGEMVAGDFYEWTAEKKAFIEVCKAEKKRIADMQKSAENSLESVKGWLLNTMLSHQVEKIESGIHKIAVSAGRESVEITSERALLKQWNKVFTELREKLPDYIQFEVKINKTALGDALRRGEIIRGAEIVRNPSLNIK